MPSINYEKFRMVFLAIVMVASTVAMPLLFTGGVHGATSNHTGSALAQSTDDTKYVYSGDGSGIVKKIDPSDQSVECEYTAPDRIDAIYAHPDGETIYIGGYGGYIQAVNTIDCTRQWVYSDYDGNAVYDFAVNGDGTLYAGGHNGNVIALDTSDGSKLWEYTGHTSSVSGVAYSNGNVYSGSWDNTLRAIDADTGTSKWVYGGHSYSVRSVATDGNGTVFSGGIDGEVHAVHASDGTNKWKYNGHGSSNVEGLTVGGDGTVYTAARNNESHSLNPSDGSRNWIYDHGDVVSDVAASGDGSVYTVGNSELHSISTSNGSNEWVFTGHAGPINAVETAYSPSVELTDPITGRVTNQHGDPVDNATVLAHSITEPALDESDARSLERQAKDLRDELTNPLPEQWDEDYDLDAHMEGASGTYALVHAQDDWGISSWSTSASSNVDEPRLQVDSDQTVIISLWDPDEDGGWFDNQVDNSFPGSTTDGEITIRQLSPTGEPIDSTTHETEVIATTTGGRVFGENEHHGVRVDLPPGVYQAVPEDHPGRGYTFVVGSPDELAQEFHDDLRDEADRLTRRTERIQDLLADDGLVVETARTDANGEFAIEAPSNAVTTDLKAMKADGTILETDENPGLDDLRNAQLSDYNGSFYLPNPVPKTVEPPAEDVQITVYRSPEVPLSDMESFADLMAFLDEQRLNETIGDLRSEYDQRFDEMERSTLERVYADHRTLVETVPGAKDRYLDRSDFDSIQDAEGLSTDELSEETSHMQVALANVGQIDPPEIDDPEDLLDIEDGLLSGEHPIPDGVEEDSISVELHPVNGEGVEVIDEEYWSVESDGFFGGRSVVVEDYPVEAEDAAAYQLRVRGAGEDGLLDSPLPIANPAFDGEVPNIRAVDVSTLSPGPDERVSLTFRADEDAGIGGIESIEAIGPDGEQVDTSIDGDTARFTTKGAGEHFVRATVTDDTGSQFVKSFSVRALEQPRSDPPTVRAERGPMGLYALAGEGVDDAEIAVDGDKVRVRAIVPGDETPGTIHVKPDAALSGSAYEIDVAVLAGPEERQVSTNLETVIHLDSLSEEATLFRGEASTWGDPIEWDGGNRYGEVVERENGKIILRTYSNDNGQITVSIDEDPGFIRSNQYRLAQWIPSFSIPFLGSAIIPAAGVASAIGTVGVGLVVGRRRVLP
ncbi:PQQ-binding-like beta-propeller repeat protein [Halosolutus gelatinilyticus]|uniref:outer membrane protein assembly factor BamB family protein n=1 Tax=Halosolutus gelatinilyticus TaxID=2931975 RepID=UPI001FF6317C|nr:PQQ-binding-like beta-propeller repeat protein [Halosolutus gelatinilyticus]